MAEFSGEDSRLDSEDHVKVVKVYSLPVASPITVKVRQADTSDTSKKQSKALLNDTVITCSKDL